MSEVNYDILARPFPKEAIKQRKGNGGIYLNYVETHTVIRRLIEATGNCFDFRVLNIEQRDGLVIATVELHIPGLGTRQHCGTARVVGGNDEDTVKCAISDSIKKVASLVMPSLLALYGPDYEAERPQVTAPARPAQARPAAANPTQTRPVQSQPQTRTASGATVSRAVAMAGTRTFRQS